MIWKCSKFHLFLDTVRMETAFISRKFWRIRTQQEQWRQKSARNCWTGWRSVPRSLPYLPLSANYQQTPTDHTFPSLPDSHLKEFLSHVMPIHDKCSQRHDNFNCQTIWLLDILPWVFRAKSFTSCPVSKETEAMVTIRDLDELSHCSLKTASGGQQAQAVLLFLQPEYYVSYCSLFIILICIFFWITCRTKRKCDLSIEKSIFYLLFPGSLFEWMNRWMEGWMEGSIIIHSVSQQTNTDIWVSGHAYA